MVGFQTPSFSNKSQNVRENGNTKDFLDKCIYALSCSQEFSLQSVKCIVNKEFPKHG